MCRQFDSAPAHFSDLAMPEQHNDRQECAATLAQMAERLTRNEQVVGSIPTGGSSFFIDLNPTPRRKIPHEFKNSIPLFCVLSAYSLASNCIFTE